MNTNEWWEYFFNINEEWKAFTTINEGYTPVLIWHHDCDEVKTILIKKDFVRPEVSLRITNFKNDVLLFMKQLEIEVRCWYLIYVRNKHVLSLDIFRLVRDKYLKRKPKKGYYMEMMGKNCPKRGQNAKINWGHIL